MPGLLESRVVATPAQWLAGARPRTLPAALAPVLAGTGVAAYVDEVVWWKALLALVVSLALQVGVNYANDYSDGIRGTDDDRVGPMRLVGSGRRRAGRGEAGRVPRLRRGRRGRARCSPPRPPGGWSRSGAVCVLAAWFYTGGSKPYGYLGLGEVMVFVFFGLVAVSARRTCRPRPGSGPRCTPASGSARWPARSSSPTTCATSRPTRWPASAPSRSGSASRGPGCCTPLLVLAAAAAVVGVAVATTWCVLVGLRLPGRRRPGAAHRARRRRRAGADPGAAADRPGRAGLGGAGRRRAGRLPLGRERRVSTVVVPLRAALTARQHARRR